MQRRLLPILALVVLPLPASATVFGTQIGFDVGFPETPAPANLEFIAADFRDDALSAAFARAHASNTDFFVAVFAKDKVFDTSSPRAYARAASGYAVDGVSPGVLIQSWIDLTGTIDVEGGAAGPDGTVEVILQVTGPGGAGPLSLLALYEITSGAVGLVETRLENCRAAIGGCETSVFGRPISWGADDPEGDDETRVEFLLPPLPDAVIDVVLWVLADNHAGKVVSTDFLSTARLTIDPPPGAVVTLDTGLAFPVPEPAGAPLAGAALACLGALAGRRGDARRSGGGATAGPARARRAPRPRRRPRG